MKMEANQLNEQQQQLLQDTPAQALQTRDEVDFVKTNNNNNLNKNTVNNYNNNINCQLAMEVNKNGNMEQQITGNGVGTTEENVQQQQQQHQQQLQNTRTNKSDAKEAKSIKKNSTKERLSLFSFGRKLGQKSKKAEANENNQSEMHQNLEEQERKTEGETEAKTDTHRETEQESSGMQSQNSQSTSIDDQEKSTTTTTTPTFAYATKTQLLPNATPPRQQKFKKTSTISGSSTTSTLARLLSSTYNGKKFEKQEQKRYGDVKKFHTYGGRRHRDREKQKRPVGPFVERFKMSTDEGEDLATPPSIIDTSDPNNLEDAASELIAGNFMRSQSVGGGSCTELATVDTIPLAERREDLRSKAMRTLSRGLGKLWFKRSHSVDISTPDPEYKVSYLGNVLTGWAKGDGCVEKQLATLWRNYTQNTKPDVIMRLKVCASGLKATTRQHGLTEYWANRITHCCAPANYPRVFCWIYRHEGRKLKHELRCHAVLCTKEKIVHDICNTLKINLELALREFKHEKLLKQNARLSLANAAYDNPSLPRRKILLSVGGNNYRPPLERSKSAPKLGAIEEAIGEEEGEEVEQTNEPEMRPCCQRDSLYPAMTLGRRRCRRGHSIRRTGKTRSVMFEEEAKGATECSQELSNKPESNTKANLKQHNEQIQRIQSTMESLVESKEEEPATETEPQRNSYGSDDSDDFDKLLKHNDYDSKASLAKELLPYFDLQLNKNKSSSLSSLHDLQEVANYGAESCSALHHSDHVADDEGEPLSLIPTVNCDPNANPESDIHLEVNEPSETVEPRDGVNKLVQLRRHGICSDGEDDEDFLDPDDEDAEIRYFRQQSILSILHRNSMRKMTQMHFSSGEESSSIETTASTSSGAGTVSSGQYYHQPQSSISSSASSNITSISAQMEHEPKQMHQQLSPGQVQRQLKHMNVDSDEGSISSGCETASTVTTPNQDDISLQYRQGKSYKINPKTGEFEYITDSSLTTSDIPVTAEEIYQRLESRLHGRNNSDATTFSSSSSITLKMSNSPAGSLHDLLVDGSDTTIENNNDEVILTSDNSATTAKSNRRLRRSTSGSQICNGKQLNGNPCDTDSECSDESGYVEYQDRGKRQTKSTAFTAAHKVFEEMEKDIVDGSKPHTVVVPAERTKPKLPPKPAPRRFLTGNATLV